MAKKMMKSLIPLLQAALKNVEDQHDRWKKSYDQYRGKIMELRTKTQWKSWQHVIETNITRPLIDKMVPFIVFDTPKIRVETSNQDEQNQSIRDMALEIEGKINSYQTELNMGWENGRAIFDSFLYGLGWINMGMTSDVGYDADRHEGDVPFLKRISPYMVYPDPAGVEPDMLDHEFVFIKNIVPARKFWEDDSLKNKDLAKPTLRLEDVPEAWIRKMNHQVSQSYEFYELFQMWHRDGSFRIIDQGGNVFREEGWPYSIKDKFPVIPLFINYEPDNFFPMGDVEFLFCLQLEQSEKRTQQLNHTRRFNRKYQTPQELPQDQKDSLERGDDGTLVISRGEIKPIADAPMSGDIYREIGMVQQEAREVVGIEDYERSAKVYSATEAQLKTQAAGVRIGYRRNRIANSMIFQSKLLFDLVKTKEKWPDYPFKFKMDMSTMERPDDETRRSQLIQFGQIAMNFPEFKKENWLSDVALTFHKSKQHYLKAQEEMVQDPSVQKAQIDMQIAQADIQRRMAETQMAMQKLQLEIQRLQAQVQSEQAKANIEIQFLQSKHQLELSLLQAKAQQANARTEGKMVEQVLKEKRMATEIKGMQEKGQTEILTKLNKSAMNRRKEEK